MQITTTTTTLDGTPEELAAYNGSLLAASARSDVKLVATSPPQYAPDSPVDVEETIKFVKFDVARRVLNRRPLSKRQKIVLTSLYTAHPDKLPASVLQEKTGYTARHLAGLMGAFGRRVSHTPGYKSDDNFFDWIWVDDSWHYGLPDSVRAAMEAEKLA